MKKIVTLVILSYVFILFANAQGFKTDNTTGNLLDANGKNFIMKGINIPLAWFVTDVNNSIPSLRTNTGANCARIVIQTNTNTTSWQTAVQKCIDNNMIPMVELHDWTGSTNTADFTTMANWFVTNAAYFKQANIAKHILINICNEWGTWQTATSNGAAWRDGFNQAVTTIRNAGINTTLVIDAVGYGQDVDNAKNIKAYAAGMINSDPQKNLLFSVHMYCEWAKGGDDIAGTLQWMRTNKIPFIVGEFGYQHATDGSCDIDEQLIMDECQAKGIGWLAWSQKGNGSPVEYLDLCADWNCTTLSTWGNTVINGTNGTKTAVTCSVFSTNVAPTVTLTSPANASSAAALSTVIISATATDSDGSISKVEFYAGTTLLASDANSPYSYSWASVGSGTYVITALAYDNAGDTTRSASRTITINPVANNTPPSCVITQPHVNAYFQAGTDVTIKVYSSDFGGSFTSGTVSKVEFYSGSTKLGETSTATSNTYSFVWTAVPAGTYTIKARATDNLGTTFTSAGVIITVGTAAVAAKGMSTCKGKYLANIIPASVRSDYGTYWNGVSAENACKWGSVEGTQDVMNWTQADIAYNYAKNNNLMFRYHALAWGSQYPSWITTLSVADFKAEMEEYMDSVSKRYPLIDQIDVLNENMYINTWDGKEHAAGTPYFRAGMGGAGTTGYDWVIWLFERARYYFPNAKLVMNDYELENNINGINEMLEVVKVLRDRGLIDGFGTQAHCFNVDGVSAANLLNSLNTMDNGGVPVYVTELDLNGGSTVSEATQLTSYTNLFPVYWTHAAVAGVTLWGYVEGATWKTGTGILNADGTKRSAMTWLQNYIAGRTDVGYPYCASATAPIATNNLLNGEFDNGTTSWDMQYNSSTTGSFTVVTSAAMSGANAAKICPTTPGTANWHVQLRQNAPFESGKTYDISFIAKADAARIMDVGIQMEGDPYTSHFGSQQNLTTANQSFNYTFSPTVTDATAKLKFYVGNNSTCVYIDNVVFKESIPAIAPPASITAASATTFCAGGSVILQANTGLGYTYQWKKDGGNITSATAATYTATLAGSYTVVVTSSGLSTTSTPTIIVVNTIPSAPLVNSPVTYELGATASALSATGTNLTWYSVATGGTALTSAPTPSTSVVSNTCYYVSQTLNGCQSDRVALCVEVSQTIFTQTISLQSGWNLLSINVHPSDSSVAALFGSAQVQTVKNADAFWRKDVSSTQSLTHIKAAQGYLVKMNANATITIAGKRVNTSNFQFPTKTGWNLIGCPFSANTALSGIFSGITTETIKNFEGYWSPNDPLSSISNLMPGNGYFVKNK